MTIPALRSWRLSLVALAIVMPLTLAPVALHAQAEPDAGTATVIVSALNVRAGPNTSFARIGRVTSGDELLVKGKSTACAWLYVETPSGIVAWVSGNDRYVDLDAACADIPTIDAEAAVIVVPTPASTPAPAATAAAQTPVPSPVAPAPTATPAPEVIFYGTVVPADKGCIAWGNYVGPDILVDATHWDTHEIIKTTLPNNEVTVVCYSPGRWAITMSAISNRFRDNNFDVEIKAGDTFDWPFVMD